MLKGIIIGILIGFVANVISFEAETANPTEGTVTIMNPCESECWSGLIYEDEDGNITVMDAVKNGE